MRIVSNVSSIDIQEHAELTTGNAAILPPVLCETVNVQTILGNVEIQTFANGTTVITTRVSDRMGRLVDVDFDGNITRISWKDRNDNV